MKNNKVGVMISELFSVNLPILMKKCGYDFIIIDCEHGAFDYVMLSSMITSARLINIEALVRLGDNSKVEVARLLDMGADGLILPKTNNAEDIKMLLEAAKYPPIGNRGLSLTRAHSFYEVKDLKEYIKERNEQIKIYAEIETTEGVNNLESILKEEGVTGVIIGPNDLAADYDLAGNVENEQILKIIENIAKTSIVHKKDVGIITTNQLLIETSLKSNINMLCIGSELSLIKEKGKEVVSKYK